MTNAERSIVLKNPFAVGPTLSSLNFAEKASAIEPNPKIVRITNLDIPTNSVFEVTNPFITQGDLAVKKEKHEQQVDDDDFDVKVVSFEEKAKVISNLTTKRERILQGTGKVISFFKEAADYKLKHMDDFRALAEQAAVMARLSAAACAPGDGHGTQSSNSINSTGDLLTSANIINLGSKAAHKEGRHEHCNSCGGDLTDGKCSKCAA